MPDTVADALLIIYDAELTPYEHRILAEDFVSSAFDPQLAAKKILRTVHGRDASVTIGEALLSFNNEWH
ncbi:hypothetical protein PWT90_05542 [Aphanocladium album]|nr:hypothetical protein PWT90_05542 [Aphanocladium album]